MDSKKGHTTKESGTMQLKAPIGFGYEFVTTTGRLIDRYLDSIALLNPSYLMCGEHSIKGFVRERMFTAAIYDDQKRNLFNKQWQKKDRDKDAIEEYYKIVFKKYLYQEVVHKATGDTLKVDSKLQRQYLETLSPYVGNIVYYAYDQRFFEQALPILSKLDRTVLVLTMDDMTEPQCCPQNILVLEVPVFRSIIVYENPFLETVFPVIYHTFNNLFFLIKILQPKSILIPEGANVIEYKMLAVLGKCLAVTTICLQHGWPGLLHTGFQNMEYDHFLCWGKAFAKLLGTVNPAPAYVCAGYPYEVPSIDFLKKKAISFFFKALILFLIKGPFLIC